MKDKIYAEGGESNFRPVKCTLQQILLGWYQDQDETDRTLSNGGGGNIFVRKPNGSEYFICLGVNRRILTKQGVAYIRFAQSGF